MHTDVHACLHSFIHSFMFLFTCMVALAYLLVSLLFSPRHCGSSSSCGLLSQRLQFAGKSISHNPLIVSIVVLFFALTIVIVRIRQWRL